MPILTNSASRFLGGSRAPAAPVPVAGAELVTNGDFSSATGWNTYPGWSVTGGVATGSGGAYTGVYRTVVGVSIGDWARISFDLVAYVSGFFIIALRGKTTRGVTAPENDVWASVRCESQDQNIYTYTTVPGEGTLDNLSVKKYTLSSLISTRPYASADCDLSAAVTRTAGTQAGFAVRVDDPANPQNFIISYLDGAGNLKTDKCVAGAYTNIAGCSGAITYVAGQRPRIVCSGNDVSVYYNGVLVGSAGVADAGIVGNKNHGLFSTYAANTFTGYTAA